MKLISFDEIDNKKINTVAKSNLKRTHSFFSTIIINDYNS